ncbi:hypothetical protein EPD60_13365 [Flaviaesturariibacter flavus]|uniref:Lipocalin-like domain-containing protein n=1 Tax=Flaviaesturariibacter flavus TaxID=2502780 RepID=A0A4R1B5G2_9BACT|nr:hypothetical protein [Flaviaesturariibacter flavus]TCJ13372.1 hypothetical protein EPD60_13365 [Flaviaesturariibacter flavus]
MKYTLFLLLPLAVACSKNQEPAPPEPAPVPMPIPPPPPQPGDTTGIIRRSWKVYKDSISNVNNFVFEYGYPNPGTYWGTASDYWRFDSTGQFAVRENGMTESGTYQLLPGNRLWISNLRYFDTGYIRVLTPTEAVFDWMKTSSNGGRYYRRVYLKQ